MTLFFYVFLHLHLQTNSLCLLPARDCMETKENNKKQQPMNRKHIHIHTDSLDHVGDSVDEEQGGVFPTFEPISR